MVSHHGRMPLLPWLAVFWFFIGSLCPLTETGRTLLVYDTKQLLIPHQKINPHRLDLTWRNLHRVHAKAELGHCLADVVDR